MIKMEQKDYYNILSADEKTAPEEIKKTYRKLAFKYHPDRTGGNPETTQKMKEINEAYATLSDPIKRREYDSLRTRFGSTAYTHFRQTYSEEDIFRGSDINQVFEEFAKMFTGLRQPEDVFARSDFYGPRYRTFEFRRPGFSARGIFFGFGPKGWVSQTHQGETIDQTGYRPPVHFRLLNKLFSYVGNKLREELEIPERGKDLYDTISVTPEEIGKKIEYPAVSKLGKSKDLLIKIPQDIKNGQKMRLKGQGAAGKYNGEPGDLYLQIDIRPSLLKSIADFLKKYLKIRMIMG